MAGFAASSGTICAGSLHAIFELFLVRVGVTTGTGQFIPVICNRLWFEAVALFVAVAARDCHVAARKDESRLFVARQRESGRSITLQIVTAITGIEVGRVGELSRMFVTMAVGATLELDFEQGVFSLGNVAARALHHGVSTLQGIRRRRMLLHF